MMQIERFVWDIVDSNSFLVTEKKDGQNHGLLIDAVDSPELYKRIDEFSSLFVILTHSHFDHIVGLNRIRELRPDCTVVATEQCSNNIGNKIKNLSSSAMTFLNFYEQGKKQDMYIAPFVCDPVDRTFRDYLQLNWFEYDIKLMAVHGHSNDGLIVKIGDILFSGDTLLHVPTITRFPSGSSKRFLEEDIRLIKKMDVETVYPGHGSPANLDLLLEINGY